MSDPHDRTPFDDTRERDLEAAVGRLPRAIEPRRDLWPGIESRLGRRTAGAGDDATTTSAHRWRGWHLALAAALLATLAGTGFGLWRLALPGGAGPRQTAVPAGATGLSDDPGEAAAAPETGAVVPGTDTFGSRLMATLERKRYALGPDASDAVQADIARLGLAVAELVAALSDHPDDPALYHQLAARQRQEADLLMRLNQL